MKKFFAIAAVALMMAGGQAFAQNRDSRKGPGGEKPSREEMVANMSRRMAVELELDGPTTEKFIPVYSAFRTEIFEALASAPKVGKDATDAEIEASIKAKFEVSRKVLDIREAYYDKFRKVLSPRQVRKLYNSEMNHMGGHMGGRGEGFERGRGGFNGGRGDFNGRGGRGDFNGGHRGGFRGEFQGNSGNVPSETI